MKLFGLGLTIIVLLLQYQVWIDDGGLPKQRQLQQRVADQVVENTALQQRNQQIAAVVMDLKYGLNTIEARARREFGMIRSDETYYRITDH